MVGKRKHPKRKAAENRRELSIEERRKIVAANILAGTTYRQIAKAVDVSIATISKDFKAILEDWKKQRTEIIGDWVSLEMARLDVMTNSLWDKVRDGDFKAIDRMLKLMERRAKLLGLDAPVKNDIDLDIDLGFEGLLQRVADAKKRIDRD